MKRIDLLDMSSGELVRHFVFDGREHYERIFKRSDGYAIPADTRIRLTIILEHIPPKGLFEDLKVEELEGVKV